MEYEVVGWWIKVVVDKSGGYKWFVGDIEMMFQVE